MIKLIKNLKNKISKSKLLFLLFVLAILANIVTKFFDVNILMSDRILFITFLSLIWYASETEEMKKEVIRQTEIEQMPFMMPYIREIDICDKNRKYDIYRLLDLQGSMEYKEQPLSMRSKYILRIRNVGKGPALNMKIESDDFIVTKYQANFFAPEPKGDEQSIQILQNTESQSKELEDLEGAKFKIYCKSVLKQEYCFKYQIKKLRIKEEEKIEIKYLGYNEIYAKERNNILG